MKSLKLTALTLTLALLFSIPAHASTKEIVVKAGQPTTALVAFAATGLTLCTPVPGTTATITVQPKHGTAVVSSGSFTNPNCQGVSFPGVQITYTWTDVAGQPGSGSDAFHIHVMGPPSIPQVGEWDIYVAEGSPTKILGDCNHCSGDQGGTNIPGQAYAGDPFNPGVGGSGGNSSSPSASGTPRLARRINSGSGNLFQQATDYTTAGENPLVFTRYYNSQGSITSFAINFIVIAGNPAAGARWRNNFDRYISLLSPSVAAVERSNGQMLSFFLSGTAWITQTDVDAKLTQSGNTWAFTDSDDTVETFSQVALGTLETNVARLTSIKKRNGYTQNLSYNASGQLTAVTDSYGRALTFAYNANGTLNSVTTPDNTVITYGYSAIGLGTNLTSVTYPTTPASTVTYLYENTSLPNALTGITDENGNRYATWGYDTSGRVVSSQLGTGANAELTSMTYNSNGTTTVTNALGVADTYTFTTLQFVPKVSQISRAATATTPAMTRNFTYDASGFLASETNWNAIQTTYINNAHGLPTTINEAVGRTVARTTTIAYSTTFPHLPASITTPGVTASFTYDTSGNLLTRTLTDTTTTTVPYSTKNQARTWTFTYDATGHVLTAKNPRTDVSTTTTFAYDASGALTSITDALNHVTGIASHTGGGSPLTIVDANNVTTALSYDGRQRVTSSTVATASGNLTTGYTIDPAGELTQVTLPDNSFLAYSYDSAHRATQVADALARFLQYTLNPLGNVTQTTANNSPTDLRYTHSATYDALGRKLTDVGAAGQTTSYTYDNNGNALTIKDGLSHQTTQGFDGLSRLNKITDANAGVTSFAYDAHDRTTTVTDPTGHVTTYIYDGFGDLIEQVSPDSGTTVYHYDADGNLTSKTDALGVVTNYTYDALDRVVTRTYPADTTQNVSFTYDKTGSLFAFGIGRLSTMTDAAGLVNFNYDERGNLLSSRRYDSTGTTNLSNFFTAYDAAGRIKGHTYPSGMFAGYARDASGVISQLVLFPTGSGASQTLLFPAFDPFGPLKFITFGNNEQENRAIDLDYRVSQVTDTNSAGVNLLDLKYTYDAANNIKSIADSLNAANGQTFGYDVLNRITSAASGVGGYGSLAWSYDKNGNLLTRTVGAVSTTYAYASGTNRIASYTSAGVTTTVTTNANGNITSIPPANSNVAATFAYNVANRLASVSGSPLGANFVYDGFGRRYSKANPGSTPITFTYDDGGTLMEENNNGAVTDYIYLEGVPVALFVPGTGSGTVYYIHTDQLGTPQLVTDANQAVVWSTTYQPYGTTGLVTASITQNLRLPGQYFDTETGFHYNGFRDYMPGIGRYLESDPIGLGGGMNPHLYTRANPGKFTDRFGLYCDVREENAMQAAGFPRSYGCWDDSKPTPEDVSKTMGNVGDISSLAGGLDLLAPPPFDAPAAALIIGGACAKATSWLIYPKPVQNLLDYITSFATAKLPEGIDALTDFAKGKLLDRFFEGTGQYKPTPQDIQEIQNLIDQYNRAHYSPSRDNTD